MAADLTEEELDRKVERLIDEKVGEDEQIDREELKKEIMEELEDESRYQEKDAVDLDEEKISRRDFLKIIGIGAGGITLSSSVAGAWAQLRASSQGLSDIDADTVDGNHASDFETINITQAKNYSGTAYLQLNNGTLTAGGSDTTLT